MKYDSMFHSESETSLSISCGRYWYMRVISEKEKWRRAAKECSMHYSFIAWRCSRTFASSFAISNSTVSRGGERSTNTVRFEHLKIPFSPIRMQTVARETGKAESQRWSSFFSLFYLAVYISIHCELFSPSYLVRCGFVWFRLVARPRALKHRENIDSLCCLALSISRLSQVLSQLFAWIMNILSFLLSFSVSSVSVSARLHRPQYFRIFYERNWNPCADIDGFYQDDLWPARKREQNSRTKEPGKREEK